jgi:hypothetical protein
MRKPWPTHLLLAIASLLYCVVFSTQTGEKSIAVTLDKGYFLSSSPTFLPPPQPISSISAGVAVGR